MRPSLLLLLALALPASAQSPGAAPAPDCSVFSLEGVRLRMTLDEAKAATPGWKWSKTKDRSGRGVMWTARDGGLIKGARMTVHLAPSGLVREVSRDYMRVGGGAFTVTYESEVSVAALDQALSERFGAVATKGASSVVNRSDTWGDSVFTLTCWTSPACDMHACIEDGKRWTNTTTVVGEMPVLNAKIVDGTVIQAEIDADASKVKF